MNLLGISGSVRSASTSTALLRALAANATADISMRVFARVDALPIFNPDNEAHDVPEPVAAFCNQIRRADGLIVATPEYVRTLPGGLKNAIDWLVSRDEIIHKPVAIAHASHRGDEMLDALGRVLGTVSDRFEAGVFLRIPIASVEPANVPDVLHRADTRHAMRAFLDRFLETISQNQTAP